MARWAVDLRFLTLWRSVAAVLGLIVLATALPASAQQDIRPLVDRLERLERDISLVQRQVYRGGPSPSAPGESSLAAPSADVGMMAAPGTDARLLQRITDLEAVLAGITGQIEEASFRIGQVGSRVEKLAADVEYRLGQLEHQASAAPAAAEETRSAPAAAPSAGPRPAAGSRMEKDAVSAFGRPPSSESPAPAPAKGGKDKDSASDEEGTLPSGSAKEQYEYISSLLGQANYPAAEKALTAFLAAHPDDPLAGNAQYWLGETYYVRNDYAKAAGVFAKGYQKYPKSGKAAANVLKLGLALARLKRDQDACTAFGRLASEFPNATGDIKRRAAQERKQLGCK